MKLLFCTDGSPAAEQAVRFGAPIAAACQAEPTVLGITEDPQQQAAVLESLGRAQQLLHEHRLNAELITKVGRPVVEIVHRTQETAYDLVVIGAARKGTRGPRWMSARAYRIIEAVAPPVLVVMGNRTTLRRILLCTGGAGHADGAVKFTAEIARRLGAAVTLFHVAAAPPAMYADLLEQQDDLTRLLSTGSALGRGLQHHQQLLAGVGVATELHLRHGLVMSELLKELAQTDYDLVVAGSSPAGDPLRRYVLPNLTREIVNRAELPVLVVRSGPAPGAHPLSDRLRHLFHPTAAPGGKSGTD